MPSMDLPLGYRWRSSQWFIITCISVALFSENFLYSYIVPILQVMLEDRLNVDKSQTQAVTSLVLSVHAFVSLMSGPLIGYLADKTPNRKTSLLASLGAEMIGTIIIMVSPSVPILLIGRSIQAIGGNAAWIVGLATISETVGQNKTGKTLGATATFFASGLLFGPMASGMLLHWVGYWMTWTVAVLVLGVDMVMRVVMIENKDLRDAGKENTESTDDGRADVEANDSNSSGVDEQTSLLSNLCSTNVNETSKSDSPTENVYKFLFTNPRALAALACHGSMAIILLSFDTTLPLHVNRTFGWDTAQVSLLFLLLQMPSLLLVTLLGMLKDRVGTRTPTGFGFLVMSCCVWLLGVAANDKLLGRTERQSQIFTLISLAGIGTARPFISGSGILEVTNVMQDAEKERANRFGPNGKMSSAYSVTNFTWNLGMLMGPIISGSLTKTVGYSSMNSVIAAMSFIVGIVSFSFLSKK